MDDKAVMDIKRLQKRYRTYSKDATADFIQHVYEGLRIVKDNAKEVVKTILFEDDPGLKLQAKYNLSKRQVQYILNQGTHNDICCKYSIPLMRMTELAARLKATLYFYQRKDVNEDFKKGNITEEEARKRLTDIAKNAELINFIPAAIYAMPGKHKYTMPDRYKYAMSGLDDVEEFRSTVLNEAMNLAIFTLKTVSKDTIKRQNKNKEAAKLVSFIADLARFILNAESIIEEDFEFPIF